ncbi:ABC-type hemin transport system substrate-binding protein [Endozoicomonas sp. NE35]
MLAMGGRTPSVSGSDTSAHALIELAGGVNPAAEQFSSYKPLSNEALLMLAPDVVVFSDQGKGTTPQQLIDMQPILKQTPAGKSGRLIAIDPGMLLGGLGPRTGELAVELAKAFFTSES